MPGTWLPRLLELTEICRNRSRGLHGCPCRSHTAFGHAEHTCRLQYSHDGRRPQRTLPRKNLGGKINTSKFNIITCARSLQKTCMRRADCRADRPSPLTAQNCNGFCLGMFFLIINTYLWHLEATSSLYESRRAAPARQQPVYFSNLVQTLLPEIKDFFSKIMSAFVYRSIDANGRPFAASAGCYRVQTCF